MNINIKTPEDILEFMKANIKYGWLDINNEEQACFSSYAALCASRNIWNFLNEY